MRATSRLSACPSCPGCFRTLANNVLSLDDPDHKRLRRLADGPFRRTSIEAMRPLIRQQIDRLLDDYVASGNPDIVAGFCRKLPLQVIYTVLGMSELVHAEEEGDKLSEDELVTLVFILFVAGHETTTHLLSTSVFTLLTEPGALDTFRRLEGDALSVAVDELMRFTGPVQMTKPRFVREDMAFEGRELKKGEKVMALLAAGNLDPAVFDDPLTLDLARQPNRHLGWGNGPHICLGLHLAKAEAEIALAELVRRGPHMALLTEPEQLKWIKRSGLRGLQALPITLS
ncbi:cytochrome P450 [Hyphomonas sp.]|jgi:cytochrome P450|uniref:cytochrome P450 n=1 Tax=Hyphomonas sp. TaxID=87 RepID=UPI0039E5E5DB